MPEGHDLPALDEALAALSRCVTLFMVARKSGSIRFGEDLVNEGTRFVSRLLLRSAQKPQMMPAYFRHWSEHGLERCQALIAKIEKRPSRMLTVNDLHSLADTFETHGPSFRLTEEVEAVAEREWERESS